MAEVIPFNGILYDVSKVSIEDVLAPPYDIITPRYRKELYKKSPYNVIRIDLGMRKQKDNKTDNRYTRAREYLEEWKKIGVLYRSERPSFYAYGMSYDMGRHNKNIIGILGLVKLEELGIGKIHPHECTYSKPKKDRLNLLRTCQANTSPIFALYKSSSNAISNILSRIAKTKPYIEASDSLGSVHRLWQIDGEMDIENIKKVLDDKDIFIADGHHRYETALEFQREMKAKSTYSTDSVPFDYVLMFLADMLDEGLTILPTHRLLKDIPRDMKNMLSEYFKIETIRRDFDIAQTMSGRRNVFGFFQNRENKWYLLTYRENNLTELHPTIRGVDVFLLHELILKRILKISNIGYEMEITKAIERVRSGEFDGAFFLNPTKIEDVERAALSSVRMPPKSTYFYPKLLTGIVINSFLNGY